MQAREMAEGLGDGLRVFRELCAAIPAAGRACKEFVKQTARAHYALMGKYTLPLEKTPPKPSDLNKIGQFALTFPIPVTIISWVSSVTWIPLIGNSIQSLPRAFVDWTNLALFDSPEDKLKKTNVPGIVSENDERAWYRRMIYGAPGYWIGASLGLSAAACIGVSRVITNSFKTATRAFMSAMNLTLHKDDELAGDRLEQNDQNRHWLRKYILSLPGLVIGGSLGLLTAGIIALGRVVTNSFKTATRAFMSAMNLTLHKDDEVAGDRLGQNDQNRHWFRKYIVGLPGLVIGGSLGLLTAGIIALGRIVTNSFKTGSRAFMSAMNLTLHKDDEVAGDRLGQNDQNRHWFRKYVVGFPGLVIGGSLGLLTAGVIALGRVVTNSFKTATRTFMSAMNLTLPKEDEVEGDRLGQNDEKRNWFRKYIVGLPGLVIGGGLGLVTAGVIALGRVVTNSIKTGTRTFRSGMNLTLHVEDQIAETCLEQIDPNAHWFRKYVVGLPGLVIGGSLGLLTAGVIALGRVVTNSFKTATRAFMSAMNLTLHKDDEVAGDRLGQNDQNRHWLRKYVVGFPGLVVGGSLGLLTAGIIALGRVLTNSFKTAIPTFASAMNLTLHKDDEVAGNCLEHLDPNRHWFRKYIVGLPGLFIGGSLGLLTAGINCLGRVVTNSFKTATRAFMSAMNLPLDAQDQLEGNRLEQNDQNRHWFRKYIVGFPGLVIGGGLGLVTAGVIALGRVVTNSVKTGTLAFRSAMNLTLHAEDKIAETCLEQIDPNPHWFRKYVVGLPGLAIGGSLGLLTAGVIALGRVVTNSFKTATRAFMSAMNLTLHKDDEVAGDRLGQNDEKRHWFRKYVVGFPGLVIGGSLGLLTAGAIALGRVVTNSFKTATRAFMLAMNLTLHAEDQVAGDRLGQNDEKRHWFRKYVVGFPGLVVGGSLGLLTAGAIALGRVVTNSFKTGTRAFMSAMNLTLHAEDQVSGDRLGQNDEKRHWFRKYVVSFPGLVVGGSLGLLTAGVIALGRVVTNSFKTGTRAFMSAMNLTLRAEDQVAGDRLGQNDEKRHWFRKYVVGLPGLVIGGSLGLLAAGVIGLGRWLNECRKSWQALSGSFVNGSLGRKIFDGLGGDQRSGATKVISSPGYLLACATTLPVSVAGYVVRQTLPQSLGLAVSIVSSPFVAIKKWFSMCCCPRFPTATSPHSIEQGFKNLYSSLKWTGRLKAGSQIVQLGEGNKGIATFIRKCFTLNTNVTTEKTLDVLLRAYRALDNQDKEMRFFAEDSAEFKKAVENLKDRYKSDCCLNPSEIASILQQIDDVAKFVREYLRSYMADENVVKVVPADFYRKETSWSATFWGGSDQKKEAKENRPTERKEASVDEKTPLRAVIA